MNKRTAPVVAMSLVCVCALGIPQSAWGRQEAKVSPTTQPAQPDAAVKPDAEKPATIQVDTVAATVDGRPIFEREVTEMSDEVIHNQFGSRQVPESMLADMRSRIRDDVVQALIDNNLIAQDAAGAKIVITDAEFAEQMEGQIQAHLISAEITREELAKRVEKGTGKSLKEFIAEQAAKPGFKNAILQYKLMTARYPEDAKITDDMVKARYEQKLEQEFKKPETVRASHILVKTDGMKTPEEKSAARAKIDGLLVEAKKPDADFAELAKKNSDCPSSAQGGDLGAFPREGAMVEPFAAAAYAMKPGEISNVVETQFGFHIIKVTERNAPKTVSQKEVEPLLRLELTNEKTEELSRRHVKKLRETAKIVVTGEQKPAEGSATTQSVEGKAAEKPAGGAAADDHAGHDHADHDHAGHDHKHVP